MAEDPKAEINKVEEEGHISDDSEEENEDPEPEKLEYKQMLHPKNMSFFLETKDNWWKFMFPVGLYYLLQFGLALSCANFYSDAERKMPVKIGDTILIDEDASGVFDTAIYLLGIFHIIEWLRTTLLLAVTTMEGMDSL